MLVIRVLERLDFILPQRRCRLRNSLHKTRGPDDIREGRGYVPACAVAEAAALKRAASTSGKHDGPAERCTCNYYYKSRECGAIAKVEWSHYCERQGTKKGCQLIEYASRLTRAKGGGSFGLPFCVFERRFLIAVDGSFVYFAFC